MGAALGSDVWEMRCLIIVYGYGDRFEGAKVLMVGAENTVIDSFDYRDGVPPKK